MSPDIALIGKARSGKDTVANYLAENHGYTRMAFADPLKEQVLSLNPWVDLALAGEDEPRFTRLADLVDAWGWERAKDVPEVRRLLQHGGQSIRDMTPDYWVERLLTKTIATDTPVVVSDCRYQNEAVNLARAGFTLIRITRPGEGAGVNGQHSSETELEHIATHGGLTNDRDIPALLASVKAMLDHFSA